ncbi:MAG: hypothetical protein JKY55_01385 [Aliivibrio sp.]|uniref:hypothetical protein n=1 Tax=Aliivibrio sp. TaxID=1872443 RepID=UPI001A601B4F|nr:hypothetical protein [Aliivibrio sp.]
MITNIGNCSMKVMLLLTLSLLSGCAEHVAERSGSDVDLFPITYTLNLNLKINPLHMSSADEELNQFIKQYWALVTTQPMSMTWRSDLGESLVKETILDLRRKGVDTNQIHLSVEPIEMDQRFDFQFTITEYRALVDRCQYTKIGHYSRTDEGCFSNGARWQSMVNPERALKPFVGER